MRVTRVADAQRMPNPFNLDAKRIYDTEHAQAIHLTLAAGESVLPHSSSVDMFFYILEGCGVVEIGTESEEVGCDTLVEAPADVLLCWHNRSDSPLRILVVKTPRPTLPPTMQD